LKIVRWHLTKIKLPVTLLSARESMWGRSSVGERRICNADVVGSNPSASTKPDGLNGSSFFIHKLIECEARL
jgi:hypothetical protein